MTIKFMDGFDHYGSGLTGVHNMLAGAWASAPENSSIGVPAWGARTGLFSYSAGGDNGVTSRRILASPISAIFLSCGFSVDGLPSSDFANSICSFRNGSNEIVINVYCQNTGAIVITDDTDTVLASSSGPVIVSRNWHFLEMLLDSDTGEFTLRVDDATGTGTPVIAATGLMGLDDTAQISVGQIGTHSGSVAAWHDDLLVRDAGTSPNDDWLGDRRIATLFANADTTTSGWTPSYYHKFGSGILRLSYVVAGNASIQAPQAYLFAVSSTQLDIGNSDFTLETMIRFDKIPTGTDYSAIFNRWDASRDLRSYRLTLGSAGFNNSCLQFDTSTDGTNATVSTPILYPWVPETNVWYHLALCRAAGELLLFVDGVQLGLPIADSTTYFGGGTEKFNIGIEQNGTSSYIDTSQLTGRLDETRFTNGVGRYTSTFTPPVAAFPRGNTDPDWDEVVLLMGYDSAINDESSFARAITAVNSATFITPNDGPSIGVFSTVNKATPDDGSFISADYVFASNVLTMTTVPADGNTITLGTTDGTTPAVYRFKNTMAAAFDVKIVSGDAQTTLENFLNAVNAGPGVGTAYHSGTTVNFDVNAVLLPIGQIEVFANTAGVAGNSIPSTATGTAAVWASSTLLGGLTIPGPTAFKLQRPPNNTTVISGMQMTVRALKTDAGTADIQSSFIGGLGGETDGAVYPLTTSVSYYSDIVETDPDTDGPISPTTIINGKFQINRTT